MSVALISETHLQINQKLNLANYRVYRPDHSTGAKGEKTAVIVSTKVKHQHLQAPRLIATYSLPSQLCPSDIDAILDSNIPTLIRRDLNAKHQCWNSRTTNSKRHALLAHSRKKDFVVADPTHPTHYPGATRQKPDILDIVVMKNLSQSMELETLTALMSDHNPVLITVGDEIECQHQGARYNYKKAEWYLYKRGLDETLTLDPKHCIKHIDQAVVRFTNAVHTAIKDSIPQQAPQRCSIYDLPSGIKHSVEEKTRARRQWQTYLTPDLLTKYNMLTKLLKTQISKHRGENGKQHQLT
ncbi:hypothetical protein NDU88_001557 [Pleurodeles waltl]|uniref:Endonuclease/exonuclease/phosphatase domain-containing protein n=1 Tax=Pleurodeles waltl TaxID=8319 RepID=A0AAV7SZZ3_PLEWA|nr:hypothetical protein NDU88_001557 [Pleurodeles waltl]